MLTLINIREIDPNSGAEIELVAKRMRATLIEVEGEAIGTALYTLDWLKERVRWHLDKTTAVAKIFLAVNVEGKITAHTIVRREQDEKSEALGLISTTYVIPNLRRSGIAEALLLAGEHWMRNQSLKRSVTWTSSTNTKLIHLYAKHGYTQTETHVHEETGTLMVKLEKKFATL